VIIGNGIMSTVEDLKKVAPRWNRLSYFNQVDVLESVDDSIWCRDRLHERFDRLSQEGKAAFLRASAVLDEAMPLFRQLERTMKAPPPIVECQRLHRRLAARGTGWLSRLYRWRWKAFGRRLKRRGEGEIQEAISR